MEQPTAADIEALKPRKGIFILAVPLVTVTLVIVAYVTSFVVAIQGRAADGERVTLSWRTCEAAQPVIAARVEAIGLGDPVFEQADGVLTLTATLPSDPAVADTIPGTLAERGWLEARVDGTPIFDSDNVTAGAIRQDLTLIPWTVLTLDEHGLAQLRSAVEANREGEVVYFLDGKRIGRVSNLKGWGPEVEINAEDAENDVERMYKTAARSVVIGSGPLPCALEPVP